MVGRPKQIATGLLVVIALAAVGAGVVRVMRDATATPESPNGRSSTARTEELTDGGPSVVVYYLHGDARCQKCVTMQTYSEAAVRETFTQQIADGTVVFREVNYHEPANAHYAEDFNISSPSLVVARHEGGQRVGYENLTDIWDLVDDETVFRAYVIHNVSKALGKP